MNKSVKNWIKQEKRIAKLLYRTGILDEVCRLFGLKTEDLYWAEYRESGRRIKNKGSKYSYREYLPEIHYCLRDYWGEYDEYSFVGTAIAHIHDQHRDMDGYFSALDNATQLEYDDWNDELFYVENDQPKIPWPEPSFIIKDRKHLIRFLSSLPKVKRDSKINKVLIRNKN